MSEKKKEGITETKISRRSMLKWTGALAAAVAVGVGAGYETDQLLRPITTFTTATATTTTEIRPVVYEEQKYPCMIGDLSYGAAMWAYVKNGRIIRFTHIEQTDQEYKPWVITTGGRDFKPPKKWYIGSYMLSSRRYLVYSPTRVKYPLKRVGFVPGGNGPVDNRGRGEFVRISWDEALSTIASEIKRINQKYGAGSLLVQSDGHAQTSNIHKAHGWPNKVAKVAQLNPTIQVRNPDSWEGWVWGAEHSWGFDWASGLMDSYDMYEEVMKNTKLIIHWGHDPETTAWRGGQLQTFFTSWFKQLGIKQIWICPDVNAAVGIWADKWIPVLSNMDAALTLGIAYVWISEGTYYKDYVYTHGYGFDKWKDYVMGVEDGVPKTPEWAEKICGTKAREIRALAREWASKPTTIMVMSGGAGTRAQYCTEFCRMIACLMCMQGVGRPGVSFFTTRQGWPEDRSVIAPQTPFVPSTSGAPGTAGNWSNWGVQGLIKTAVPEGILNPSVTYVNQAIGWPKDTQYYTTTFPKPGASRIHMIWMTNPCYIPNWNKGNKMAEAFRSPEVEFILAQHPWLESDCLFADIVLPGKSSFERTDLGFGNLGVGYWVVYCPQCIDPIGESKSDFETCLEIAKRLGVENEFTGGKTAEDLLKSAFNASTAAKLINYEDWKKKGYFVIPFPPMDQYVEPKRQKGGPGIRWFYQQSEGSGINTPSGKIEFYSQNLAKYYPDDEERPPLPHYIPYGVTNQESLSHPRAKQYPLLICSNHPRWRHHARYDGSSWVREIPEAKILNGGYYYEPIWINPTDAQARGIKHGDVVKVYNERGTVIMGAYVTERIMPGVVMASEGAAYDPVDVGKVDKGGCINSISPSILSRYAWGMNVSGFLLQIEKWQGPVPQSIREKRMTGG